MIENILAVVGAVSGIISLIGIILVAGVWKGRVDADRDAWTRTCEAYPPAELWLMCSTMWKVFIEDTLHKRPDLAERQSPYRLKDKGKDLIPATIKRELDLISSDTKCNDDIANGWLVVKHLGLNPISIMAKEKGLSVQEAVAVLSTYLDERFGSNNTQRGGENGRI